jgi:hypothetical protein
VASSFKNSGGGVLIAVKRDFDVDVIATRHGLLIKLECMQVKCSEYSYYISAVYLAPDVGKSAYDMFVGDMDAIFGSKKMLPQKKKKKVIRGAPKIICARGAQMY